MALPVKVPIDSLAGVPPQVVAPSSVYPRRRLTPIAAPTTLQSVTVGDSVALAASSAAASAAATAASSAARKIGGVGKQITGSSYASPLLALAAAQSPIKQQTSTQSEITVNFVYDASDTNYWQTNIWVTGYHGNTSPVLMASSQSSPVNFILDSTGEKIQIIGQTVNSAGASIPVMSCPSVAITLSGVVTDPPAPTISQTLVAIPLGYQFAFDQVNLGSTEDVINSYRVYRSTSNSFSSASLLRTIPQNSGLTGAVTVQDNVGGNETYYYWVTSVNTKGLESTAASAQTGAVISGTASLDNDVEDGTNYKRTTAIGGSVVVVENPNFALGTAGWSPAGTATIVSSSSSPPISDGNYCVITTAEQNGGLISNQSYKCAPGDIVYFGAWIISDGTFEVLGQLNVHNGAGTAIQFVQFGNYTTGTWKWFEVVATLDSGADNFTISIIRGDSSGGSHAGWVTGIQVALSSGVMPNNVSSLLNGQGSIVSSTDESPSYTSTTTTITWTWSSFSMYMPDGSTATVASGSKEFTGLSSSTTYYFEFYVDVSTLTMTAALSNEGGGEDPSSLAYQVQTMNADGYVGAYIDLTAATTASGSGGGSGGGGTCFSGEVKVLTPDGYVRIDQLEGEILNKTGRHKAVVIVHHRRESDWVQVLPLPKMDGCVTPDHLLGTGAETWLQAKDIIAAESFPYRGDLYDLQVDTDDPASMHFVLENGMVAHNKKRLCFSEDVEVWTPSGWRKISEVPGAKRHDGCSDAALCIFPSGSLVTRDHPLRWAGKGGFRHAEELLPPSNEKRKTLWSIPRGCFLRDGYEAL